MSSMRVLLSLAGALLGVALVGVPGAAAQPAGLPIVPDEQFGGTVNDAASGATIQMDCAGPGWPGETGHPVAGQTLGIFVPEALYDPDIGNTGDDGTSIVAEVVTPGIGWPQPAAVFDGFDTFGPIRSASLPLPTSLELPCSGPGAVLFVPCPLGPGAKPFPVDVTFATEP